jgi:hypothetical protein
MTGTVMQKTVGTVLVCALFCFIQGAWTDSTAAEPAALATAASVVGSGVAPQASSDAPLAQVVMEKLAHSPAVFIENQGQWEDETIRFALSSMGANVGLTDEGVRFRLFQRESEQTEAARRGLTPEERSDEVSVPGMSESMNVAWASRPCLTTGKMPVPRGLEFALRFEGARSVVPEGEGKSEQVFHYHRGEPARWRENVPSWEAVVYRNLYEGIDLRVTGKRTGIKFEFIVAPGADWRQIRICYNGIQGLALRDNGWLEIRPGKGWAPITDDAPHIYQEIDGKRHAVEGRFALVDSKTWRFEILGDFDPTRQLIIDPDLEWSTYLGGSREDIGYGIAVDGSGNIVVTGETYSTSWVSGGFDTTLDGSFDAFVAKLSGQGAHLWSSYLGGSDYDFGLAIAVDGSDNIVVTGDTTSSGWISGGFDTTFSGSFDAFIVKLSPQGAHLWSTFLGGTYYDYGNAIAVDASGDIVVTGGTVSSGWVSGGMDTTYNGGGDAFVAKLSSSSAHLWSTYLGGSNEEYGHGVAVDGSGNIVVTGRTGSGGWVSGGIDTIYNGGLWDGFVAKLSPQSAHLWSTYLGGTDWDCGLGIAVDGSGSVMVTGGTESIGWVSGGFDTTYNGSYEDAFVAKLSSSGAHLWSSYLGGSDWDDGQGIAVDGSGNIVVTGWTGSGGWVSGGFDTTNDGNDDAFVVKLSQQGAHLWSTYVGGSGWDEGNGSALDASGNIVVTGWTNSTGWVSGGFDTTYNGYYDGFVAKIRVFIEPSPIVYYTFASDEEGWTTGRATSVFTAPDFPWKPDFLTMTSRTNTNTFGFWQSPQDAVPADPGYLYHARFNVSSDLTVRSLVPQIRLRANSLNLQQYDVLSIDSAGDGGASPDPRSTHYDLYFVPPANDMSVMLAFDLLNFNPFDAAVAELALDTVTVYRFALDSLGPATVVRDYTFDLSQDGWTTGGAPILFTPPDYIHSGGALRLTSHDNTTSGTFGFWTNPPADITIEPDTLYRGTFEVRTDVTNPALVPEMRLRFNAGNFQASSMLGIVSFGDGANSPGTTNATYNRLYFLPPASSVGESLVVSFDILNFNPEDAAEASLILDRVRIENFPIPAVP